MGVFSSPSAAATVFKETAEPTGWQDGDLWIDLGQDPPILKLNDNGTARIIRRSIPELMMFG